MDIQTFVQHGLKREIPQLLDFPEGEVLNLGAGYYVLPGATPLDYPQWDADMQAIPRISGTVSGIWALHFLEHVIDPVVLLRDMERVLRPGGVINILVPHAKSEMAFHDIDHKHVFTEETWGKIFNNPMYGKYGPGTWKLKIHANFLCGVTHRNLANFVQLVKEG